MITSLTTTLRIELTDVRILLATIANLIRFIDHVEGMPQLSCEEFKEMRCLSQFERTIRKVFKLYFQPSNQNLDSLSGFEKFLFNRARRHKNHIKKWGRDGYSSAAWANKLFSLLKEDIVNLLPKEVESMCKEVYIEVNTSRIGFSTKESFGAKMTKALICGEVGTIIGFAFITYGLTLLALPCCAAMAVAHSKTWSREDVISKVVFGVSEQSGMDLCEKVSYQISSLVDKRAEEIRELFSSAAE